MTHEERQALIRAPLPKGILSRHEQPTSIGWGGVGNPMHREHIGYEEIQGGYRRLPMIGNRQHAH